MCDRERERNRERRSGLEEMHVPHNTRPCSHALQPIGNQYPISSSNPFGLMSFIHYDPWLELLLMSDWSKSVMENFIALKKVFDLFLYISVLSFILVTLGSLVFTTPIETTEPLRDLGPPR